MLVHCNRQTTFTFGQLGVLIFSVRKGFLRSIELQGNMSC